MFEKISFDYQGVTNTTLKNVIVTKCISPFSFGVIFSNIEKVDLSGAESFVVNGFSIENNNKINLIKFRATEQISATAVASAITNATADNGTVYLNSADTYYQTVADAATAKGWTIENL